jgi:peptide-methionine (S)-S-oxide reductase
VIRRCAQSAGKMEDMMTRILMLALGVMVWAGVVRADTAVFAGGCFWCVESDFESVPGVSEVVSGYTGGGAANPTYEDHEGHLEAVQIRFDPAQVSYETLVHMFLRSVDVTDAGGQFCDRGPSYATAIFVRPGQKAAAEAAVAEAEADLGRTVVTPVRNVGRFWVAEAYHQDYYKGSNLVLTRSGPKTQKNAYAFYRNACGRDARVKALWGKAAAFGH